jgi:hypothetical protein
MKTHSLANVPPLRWRKAARLIKAARLVGADLGQPHLDALGFGLPGVSPVSASTLLSVRGPGRHSAMQPAGSGPVVA